MKTLDLMRNTDIHDASKFPHLVYQIYQQCWILHCLNCLLAQQSIQFHFLVSVCKHLHQMYVKEVESIYLSTISNLMPQNKQADKLQKLHWMF